MSRAVVTAAALLLLASSAHAVERGPLPAFALASADGRSVGTVNRTGAWVVIHVPAGCATCDGILRSLDSPEVRALASKIVVVVGLADPQPVLEGRHPQLQQAAWLTDASDAVGRWLGAGSTLTVLGVRDGIVEWSVGGVLTDARDLLTIVTNWLR